ncbi:MAG: hypothetical protein JNK46_09460 [Methylobacteriaceae bacterium]|nr:hypothetical protein [Methylobacteriaceae bacterium]
MTARPDRRAALAAEIRQRLANVESELAAIRPIADELATLDDSHITPRPGKMLPIVEAARIARVSTCTARRRAKECGRKGADGAWRVDPSDLADRRYSRPPGV